MFQKEILPNPDPDRPRCHCATIAQSPGGDLIVAWYAYPEEETRGGTLMLTRRRAGGTRFDQPRRILSDMNSSLGNPVLFFDGENRLQLLFVALRGHYWDSAVAYSTTSEDLGRTWSTQETIRQDPGMMVRYPPIARQNTYLLLPAYDEKSNQTVIMTAGPDAQGWFPVSRLEGIEAIQGSIVRMDSGDLAMLLRPTADNRCCLRSISGDDGKSWSPVTRTTLPNPLSGVAAFAMGDTLCAVYNHTTKHQRYPLSLSYSTNGGTSWSDPIHIDETQHEVSYPSFIVDPSGVAHGVYTFGRNRIQYVTFDQTWWKH